MKINPDIMTQSYDRTLERDLSNFKNKAAKKKSIKKYESSSAMGENKNIEDKKLKLLANEFTSILMKQMFKSMRKTIPDENKFIDGGFSEEVFTDMLDGELSKSGTEQNGFNSLGRLLYQQLKSK